MALEHFDLIVQVRYFLGRRTLRCPIAGGTSFVRGPGIRVHHRDLFLELVIDDDLDAAPSTDTI